MAIARVFAAITPAQRPVGRRNHLAYLDGTRAIAAIYVVLHHCYQWVWAPTVPDWAWPYVGWFAFAHFAVSAFIAISGFSLMLRVVRDDGLLVGGGWTFFKRRARRILPPYYFAIAVTLLLDWLLIGKPSGTVWDLSLPVTPRTILVHLFLVHNLDPVNNFTINGVFWSIAVEWQIYFFFPLLVVLIRRLNALAVVLSTFVLCALFYLGFPMLWGHVLNHVPPNYNLVYLSDRLTQVIDYLGLFTLGMLAALLAYAPHKPWEVARQRVPWGLVGVVSFVGLAGTLALYGRAFTHEIIFLDDILTALAVLALFVAAARSRESLAARTLGWKPLAFVGTYAYSVYLMHTPIIAVIYLYGFMPYVMVPFHLSNLSAMFALMGIVTPVVLVLSYIFFLFFERPFLKSSSRTKTDISELPTLVLAAQNRASMQNSLSTDRSTRHN